MTVDGDTGGQLSYRVGATPHIPPPGRSGPVAQLTERQKGGKMARHRVLSELERHTANAEAEGRIWAMIGGPIPPPAEMTSPNFGEFLSAEGRSAHRWLLPATFRRAFRGGYNAVCVERAIP